MGLRRRRPVGNREQRREGVGLRRQSSRSPECLLRCRRQSQLSRHLRRRQGPPLLTHPPQLHSLFVSVIEFI